MEPNLFNPQLVIFTCSGIYTWLDLRRFKLQKDLHEGGNSDGRERVFNKNSRDASELSCLSGSAPLYTLELHL